MCRSKADLCNNLVSLLVKFDQTWEKCIVSRHLIFWDIITLKTTREIKITAFMAIVMLIKNGKFNIHSFNKRSPLDSRISHVKLKFLKFLVIVLLENVLTLETNLDFLPCQSIHDHHWLTFFIGFIPSTSKMEYIVRFHFEPFNFRACLWVSWPDTIPCRSIFVVIKDESFFLDRTFWIKF